MLRCVQSTYLRTKYKHHDPILSFCDILEMRFDYKASRTCWIGFVQGNLWSTASILVLYCISLTVTVRVQNHS